MPLATKIRRLLTPVLAASLFAAFVSPAIAQPGGQRGSGPHISPRTPGTMGHIGPNQGEHLAQWMDRHSNLPLPQQQRALEK